MSRVSDDLLAEIAAFFCDLRRYLGRSAGDIAHELGVPVRLISALELGRIDLLPPWPETVRLVEGYATIAGIDPRPALTALEVAFAQRSLSLQSTAAPVDVSAPVAKNQQAGPQFEEPIADRQQAGPRLRVGVSGKPVPAPALPVDEPPHLHRHDFSSQPVEAEPEEKGIARHLAFSPERITTMPRWAARSARPTAIIVLVFGLTLLLAINTPRSAVVSATTDTLPEPVAAMVRSAHEFLLHRFARQEDGLRWIDVDDPRARRTDKLPTPGQTD